MLKTAANDRKPSQQKLESMIEPTKDGSQDKIFKNKANTMQLMQPLYL